MALDTSTPRSRRTLLLGGIGAVAGALAAAVARPLPVSAAPDSVSYTNDENAQTVLSAESVKQNGFPNSGRGVAVYAGSFDNVAVYGSSLSAVGIQGQTGDGDCGVLGIGAIGTTGVAGVSLVDGSTGTPAIPAATGVFGFSDATTGVGVYGRGLKGRGGQFSGSRAQLRLIPSSAPSHPVTGSAGDLFVDGANRLWFCTQGGRVAVWNLVQLATT